MTTTIATTIRFNDYDDNAIDVDDDDEEEGDNNNNNNINNDQCSSTFQSADDDNEMLSIKVTTLIIECCL